MSRRRRDARDSDAQLAELKVRLQTLAEISVSRHGELARAVNERLDRMTHRVGSDLTETARKTTDSIAKLHERLAVIDSAQKNLTDLSSNMVSLQEILANKQARGAFGQMRMEAIIQDGLPKGAFTFQATLSNGKRPDCLLHMPNTKAGVVIDAKFPLEGFEAFRVGPAPRKRRTRRGACASMSGAMLTPWPSAISCRGDAGHRHPVRAVGSDLCGFVPSTSPISCRRRIAPASSSARRTC